MDLFFKRSTLVAIVCALPIFGSFASGSGGGHSSGGSGGGHSSSGPTGGHSSTSSNSGHPASTTKSSHAGDSNAGPAVTNSRSTSVNPTGPVRVKPAPVVNKHFESGYGHNDLSETDDQWRKQHRHLRHLFGFIPYWSSY
jgi:hypothetical protein